MKNVLDNINVLDLSRFIAGPYCSMLLADMGANVIKVERPAGEDSRQVAPFINGHSIYTMAFNRNKRAISLNTRAEKGRELLKRLVRWADVIVENYRPGTMEKMGLGYEELKAINSDIILTSISGFGQNGPYKDRAAFDAIAQAMSGLMYQNGRATDPPMRTGIFMADYVSGQHAALGTMFALFHRERTGEGQMVDVAVLDSIFSCMGLPMMSYLNANKKPHRTGNRDPFAAPASAFEARDGYIYLHGGTPALFERLTAAMENEDLREDPRFTNWSDRMEHVEEIEEIVASWVHEQSVEEVGSKLAEAGIPFSPVADIPEVARNPQLAAREMLVNVNHREVGPVSVPGITVKLSETPGRVEMEPPTVGQHNEEIYCGLLGLSTRDIEELQKHDVV